MAQALNFASDFKLVRPLHLIRSAFADAFIRVIT